MTRYHNINGKRVKFTSEEETARDVEEAEWEAQQLATQYIRDRQLEYPSWNEQQDMQFHDAIDGTTTWQDAIQAVKNKYPKSG